jgi:ribosomal protein S18 acetylase RimI-like enzyme
MIRPTVPSDTPELIAIAEGTGVFKPLEITALQEVLDDYHEYAQHMGHRSITFDQKGKIAGFAYFAPAAMTDHTWYLYWIAVTKQIHAKGVGSQLLRYVEDEIRNLQGRILLIETSSLPHYELTRKFYVKHNYEQTAVLKDFYTDGDDMVVFRKRMKA